MLGTEGGLGQAIVLVVSFIVSLAATLLLMPWVMSAMRKNGIIGKDRNKRKARWLPEMGGIGVLLGYLAGLIGSLAILELVLDIGTPYPTLFICGMFCILGIAFIGVVDDLFDIRQRMKAFLPMFFAIPLAIYAVQAFGTKVNLFGLGQGEIGSFMIFLILFAVTAASNGANMLEGYNGLGAGLAIIIAGFLTFVAIIQGRFMTLLFLVPLIGASLAFLRYNSYPAKVFPGDTYTLFYGGVVAVAVIVGPLKEVGAFLFIPMIIEFFLKLTSKFEAENFGRMDQNGNLRYKGPVQSLTHFVMKNFKVDERRLVWSLWALQLLICAATIPLLVH